MFLKTVWKPLRSKAEKIDSLVKIFDAFLATHSKSKWNFMSCVSVILKSLPKPRVHRRYNTSEGIFYHVGIQPPSMCSLRWSHSKFWNKMYPFARGSRVEASTIGIISIGWADFRLILVSRAPTYCNHADILYSCNARSSTLDASLSPHTILSTNLSLPPLYPLQAPPLGLFLRVRPFPPASTRHDQCSPILPITR